MKRNRPWTWLIAMAVVGAAMGQSPAPPASAPAAPAPPELLGAAGNLRRLQITGVPPAVADDLRHALIRYYPLLHEAAPSTPIKVFLPHLAGAARQALLAGGYPDATADATNTDGPLKLVVHAGEKYKAGAVRVDAPAGVDIQRIAELLTKGHPADMLHTVKMNTDTVTISLAPQPDASDVEAFWNTGGDGPFYDLFAQRVQDAVQTGLWEQGFSRGKIGVSWDRDTKAKTAALHVAITDVGPRMVLTQVDVSRTGANSPELVRQFLGITVGQPVDLRTVRGYFDKLYESGRFARQTMLLTALSPGKAALQMDLEEIPDVPRLDQPLSETEQALLRARDFAQAFVHQPDDLEMSFKQPHGMVEFTIGTRGGLFVDLSPADAGAFAIPLKGQVQGQLLFTPDTFAVRFNDEDHYFAKIHVPARPFVAVLLEPHNFYLGTGANFARQPEDTAFELRALVEPAAMLSLAHSPDYHVDVKDGVLTASGKSGELTADAKTGRLLRWTNSWERGASAHASLAAGRMEAAPGPNLYDAAHPVGSVIRISAIHLLPESFFRSGATDAEKAAARAVVGRILPPHQFDGLESGLQDALVYQGNLFVPMGNQEWEAGGGFAKTLSPWMPAIDSLFAYGSWPHTLLRESLFPHDAAVQAAEIRRLFNDPSIGPLGDLCLAESSHNPDIARGYAQHGLDRLNAQALAADLDVLLSPDAPGSQMLRSALEHLRDLPAADEQTLAAAFDPSAAGVLDALYRALQLQKEQPLEKAIPAITADIYPAIKPYLEGRLAFFVPPQPQVLPDLGINPP